MRKTICGTQTYKTYIPIAHNKNIIQRCKNKSKVRDPPVYFPSTEKTQNETHRNTNEQRKKAGCRQFLKNTTREENNYKRNTNEMRGPPAPNHLDNTQTYINITIHTTIQENAFAFYIFMLSHIFIC